MHILSSAEMADFQGFPCSNRPYDLARNLLISYNAKMSVRQMTGSSSVTSIFKLESNT